MIFTWLFIIGFNIYLPWRLSKLFSFKNKLWLVLLYILFIGGFILAPVSISLKMRFDSILVSAAYNLSGAWLGMFLYLAIIMVIFEIINLIYRLPRVKAGWMVIVLAAAISAYALFNAASFKIAEITIPIKGLENEVKIMLITDVHLGASRGESYLADIVKRTNELNPDFVVLAGDIVDSKVALRKNMLAPLKDLQSPGFFVYGNHDVYVGLDKVIQSMEENGIKVMQNDVLVVNGITLIGLNYMIADESVYDPHRVTDETIKDVLPTLDLSGENPKIVLHHGPWGIEYMNEYGVNLVLTGHTHAGQMFPINHIVKTIFPYDKGLIEYNGTYMYISQGAGTFMSRMRLGTNNEINFITLEPSR